MTASEPTADRLGRLAARDRGLKKGVGAWGLGVAVFNVTVGAGIFALPAALARELGPAAPVAYLVVGLATAAVAICFAAAGSRAPTSGGSYGFVEAAFGPYLGFLVGVLVWLGCVLAAGGVAAAVADNLGRLVPALSGPSGRAGLVLAMFAVLATVNIWGVTRGTELIGLLTVVKLAPLAVLVIVGAVHVHPENLKASVPAVSAFGRATLLAAFAFQGMESAVGVSGEVHRPARNIPRAILGALAAAALLYMAIQVVTQGVLGPDLAKSTTPLADAMGRVSPALFTLLILGASLSQLGYLAGDTLGAPRLLFAFSRDGFLPKAVGAVQPRTHAPWAAIAIHTGLGATLALTGSFIELATLAALASVVVYFIACLAAVALQRRGVAQDGPPLAFRGLWIIALLGAASMVWLGLQASRAEMIGCAATLAIATVWYAVARLIVARRPSAPA